MSGRAAGIEVWFDQSELRGGDVWDQTIRKEIKSCVLFIPVISRHTHERDEGYFRLEWKLAVDRSHLMTADKAFLLPVAIDDTREDDEGVPWGDAAAYQYAQIYAQWADAATAMEWLNTAVRLRTPWLEFVKTDPLLDPLRKEPRFQSIERALKFPN